MKKHNLILGIGGTGTKAVQSVFCWSDDCAVVPIVFDTDARALEKVDLPCKMDLSASESLGAVLDRLDPATYSWLSFYGSEGRARVECAELARMNLGSGGWRAKAVLAFSAYCKDKRNKQALHSAIDKLFRAVRKDDTVELYVVASLAGGTGSGLLLPVTLYVKNYIFQTYKARVSSAALLLSPEAFSGALPKEQLLLANSNAYATMRELNAVNRAAWGKTEKHDARFVIGNADDPALGLLFDSADPHFQSPEILPFQRVYLCGRNLAAETPGEQIDLFSEILSALCRGKILEKALKRQTGTPEAIYSGISLSRLQTGAPEAAEFIGLNAVSDFFRGNFGRLAKEAEGRLSLSRRENPERRSLASEANAYWNAVLEAAPEKAPLEEILDSPESETGADRFDDDFFEDLLSLVKTAVCTKETERFLEELSVPVFPQKKRPGAKERRKLVLNAALSYIEKLRAVFSAGYATITETRDALIAELLDTVAQNGAAFESPEATLVGFCRFYRFVCKKSNPSRLKITPENLEALFPPEGENPLSLVLGRIEKKQALDDPRFLRELEKAEPELRQDACKNVFSIRSIFTELVYSRLKENLFSMIGKYRQLFKKVDHCAQRVTENLTLLLRGADLRTPNAVKIYTVNDDRHFYAEYEKKELKALDINALLGKEFYRYALENDDLQAYGGAGIVDAVQKETVAAVLAGPYYGETVDRNIAEAFAYKCEREPSFAEKIFSFLCYYAKPTLKRTRVDEGIGGEPAGEAGYLILPPGVAEDSLLRRTATGFFLEALPAGADQKSFAILYETPALEADSLGAFNESSREAVFYTDYVRSLRYTREFATPVWYPHIIGNMEYQNQLPFLSVKKQADYRRDTVQALLWAISHGLFSVDRATEGHGDALYFRAGNGSRLPVTVGDKPLAGDDWYLLPVWLHHREEKIEQWSSLFREWLAQDLRALPAFGFSRSNPAALTRAIGTASMIRVLKKDLFDQTVSFGNPLRMGIFEFAYRISLAEEKAGSEPYAQSLLAEGFAVIRSFCNHRIPPADAELRQTVRERVEAPFFAALRDSAGPEEAAAILEWVQKSERD